MVIFTKNVKDSKFEIRQFGSTFWIDRDEAQKLIDTGQAFFKANKPVRNLNFA